MIQARIVSALGLALVVLGSAPPAVSQPVLYTLGGASEFERGCFGPCACPVFGIPMRGSFVLTLVSHDPLFTTYSLSDIDWKATSGSELIRLTGSGTYRVGGEVAVQHQLVLDLSLDGGPIVRFDSGIVVGGGDFPKINIEAARHGFACYDTVLAVHAAPGTSSSTGRNVIASISRPDPNPFRSSTQVDVALSSPARVDLTIFDARGRAVKRLARALALEAGTHPFLWNGSQDDGNPVAAGTYFLRLVVNGHDLQRRIVKLQR